MSETNTIKNNHNSLQKRSFEALRIAKEILQQGADPTGYLDEAVQNLEAMLFSAEASSGQLLESYLGLNEVLKKANVFEQEDEKSLRPIGLQVATANDLLPIKLEWSYPTPNALFVIEYAKFDEADHPDWRVYSKTKSLSFTIRGLQKGKSYWFRISALAPAV